MNPQLPRTLWFRWIYITNDINFWGARLSEGPWTVWGIDRRSGGPQQLVAWLWRCEATELYHGQPTTKVIVGDLDSTMLNILTIKADGTLPIGAYIIILYQESSMMVGWPYLIYHGLVVA